MLNDLIEELHNEVEARWKEIAHFAVRRADFAHEDGARGYGYIMLPDADAMDAYNEHFSQRARRYEAYAYINSHSTRKGGVFWYNGIPQQCDELDVTTPEYDSPPDDMDEQMERDRKYEQRRRDAFVAEHGLLEWVGCRNSPEDGAVVVALQVGDQLVWDVFQLVNGMPVREAADAYGGPTHPGTRFSDENILLN